MTIDEVVTSCKRLGVDQVPHHHRNQNAVTIASFELEGGPFNRLGQREKGAAGKKRQRNRTDILTYESDKDISCFEGFRSLWWKELTYYLIGLLTAGLSFLLCRWSPRLYILLSLSPCALKDAQYVRVRLVDGRMGLERIQEVAMVEPHGIRQPDMVVDEESTGMERPRDSQVHKVHRLMEYRCTRYFYMDRGLGSGAGSAGAGSVLAQKPTFVPLPAVPKGFNEQLIAAAQTLASTGSAAAAEMAQECNIAERQLRYGKNEMIIPVKSIPMLVFDEMWHPFYVFQYCSVIIWLVDEYYAYAVCIFVITMFSVVYTAFDAHNNRKRLADIAHFECEVDVIRDGEVVRLPSSALVPGDLVVVGPGTLPCDMVLLRGECILDENMLTGESVPVRKVPYNPVADGLSYEPEKCPSCTLFGGTVVAQARAPRNQKVVAMVCRTRFYSAKGQLLRSILFPREHKHEAAFVSDSLKFICGMLVLCLALYIWAAVVLTKIGASPGHIVLRLFDMITIAVPPALPACLTIATVLSIGRLRKKGIYVTSPDRIAMAGQLDVICFDKTGTLTEQGLDLQGIVPIVNGRLHDMVSNMSLLPIQLVELLASCHGLARMGEVLVGDPLDQKLFLATQWELLYELPSLDGVTIRIAQDASGDTSAKPLDGSVESADGVTAIEAVDLSEVTGTAERIHTYVRPSDAAHAFAIIKRFEFSAALQRNLVVVRSPDGSVAVFAKGSPEAIRSLVDPTSVPSNFESLLGELTREGLRVLALAAGDASGVPEGQLLGWTQAETEAGAGLRLVGLAVMANPLRKDTLDVIEQLQRASIRTVMVTGDHLRTAISVAHKCAILPTERPILLVDAADTPPPPHSSTTATAASTSHAPAALPLPINKTSLVQSAAATILPSEQVHGEGERLEESARVRLGEGGTAEGKTEASIQSSPQEALNGHYALPEGTGEPAEAASPLGLRLSVLNADGIVGETVSVGSGFGAANSEGLSELIARLLTGELGCGVTGKGFDCLLASPQLKLHPQQEVVPFLLLVLQRAAVFARMSPDNKRDLMLLLGSGIEGALEGCPHLGLVAGFCGDGANDCGALKAAHVGVSLCEAEASVAAPMTSKAQTIASMITVVAEGRCTLMATFQIFQFIIVYALVQAFEANLMYSYALSMGDYQYLIEDLFFATVLAALMGMTAPRSKLSRRRPLQRVTSPPLMLSTVAQCVVVVIFQLASLWMVQAQPNYTRYEGAPELEDVVAPENTVTYIVALAQLVVTALVFNKGRPHRSPIWTNLPLMAVLIAQAAFVFYTLFAVDKFNTEVQELVDTSEIMDMMFRWKLLGLLLGMCTAAFVTEFTCVGINKLVDWARG